MKLIVLGLLLSINIQAQQVLLPRRVAESCRENYDKVAKLEDINQDQKIIIKKQDEIIDLDSAVISKQEQQLVIKEKQITNLEEKNSNTEKQVTLLEKKHRRFVSLIIAGEILQIVIFILIL